MNIPDGLNVEEEELVSSSDVWGLLLEPRTFSGLLKQTLLVKKHCVDKFNTAADS
jgi:hypothetical protein